jgi:hypothetical protein
MADDAKDELKALVVRARQEKLGKFPETLRQRLFRYAVERWRAGVSVKAVADELGMSGATLAYWRAQSTAGRTQKIRPVKVVERFERRHTVAGPSGTQVGGLSLDEVAELFRKLS